MSSLYKAQDHLSKARKMLDFIQGGLHLLKDADDVSGAVWLIDSVDHELSIVDGQVGLARDSVEGAAVQKSLSRQVSNLDQMVIERNTEISRLARALNAASDEKDVLIEALSEIAKEAEYKAEHAAGIDASAELLHLKHVAEKALKSAGGGEQ